MLRTRAPVSCQTNPTFSLDLHVLGLPLAFILSQDQTLHCKMFVWPGIPKYSIFGWLVIPYSVSFKELYKLRSEDPFIACFPFSFRNGVQKYNAFSILSSEILKKFLPNSWHHILSLLLHIFKNVIPINPWLLHSFQTPCEACLCFVVVVSIRTGCKSTTVFHKFKCIQ